MSHIRSRKATMALTGFVGVVALSGILTGCGESQSPASVLATAVDAAATKYKETPAVIVGGGTGGSYAKPATIKLQIPPHASPTQWQEVKGVVGYKDHASGGLVVKDDNGKCTAVGGKPGVDHTVLKALASCPPGAARW